MGDPNANAKFCSTVIDEFVASGVTDCFISPGSRSAPLSLAAQRHPRLTIHGMVDERTCGFAALGHAKATGTPAIAICTSGTAAAHFLAPIIEASESSTPLIVLTADRPTGHIGRMAPQTTNQTRLYGDHVRHFCELGAPNLENRHTWRALASQAFNHATGPNRGPVHMNCRFDKPLLPASLNEFVPIDGFNQQPFNLQLASHNSIAPEALEKLAVAISGRKGIIVAGDATADPEATSRLGEALGWPVLAATSSRVRGPTAINYYETVLSAQPWVETQQPEFALCFGTPPVSFILKKWLTQTQTTIIRFDTQRYCDPWLNTHAHSDASDAALGLLQHIREPADPQWLKGWQHIATIAEGIIDRTAPAVGGELTGVSVVQEITETMRSTDLLWSSSSMSLRLVEWFSVSSCPVGLLSNNGCNGIDGVIASATGAALSGRPTTLITGDVAFAHDLSSLANLQERDLDLTIVVLDNAGGRIFDLLPRPSDMSDSTYEKLFSTPVDLDYRQLAQAHNIPFCEWTKPFAKMKEELPASGPKIIVAKIADYRQTLDSIGDQLSQSLEISG